MIVFNNAMVCIIMLISFLDELLQYVCYEGDIQYAQGPLTYWSRHAEIQCDYNTNPHSVPTWSHIHQQLF